MRGLPAITPGSAGTRAVRSAEPRRERAAGVRNAHAMRRIMLPRHVCAVATGKCRAVTESSEAAKPEVGQEKAVQKQRMGQPTDAPAPAAEACKTGKQRADQRSGAEQNSQRGRGVPQSR